MAPVKVTSKEAKQEEKTTVAPTVSEFYEIEDRLAASLSNQKIETQLKETTEFIHTQLLRFGSDPEAFKINNSEMAFWSKRSESEDLTDSGARQKVEGHFLQLQNFKSEVGHLRKAIDACLEFQSSDCDIDLVPVEEFYEKAPESISQAEVTKKDDHQLHLARLNYELYERKNMLGNLQELEGRKSVLLSDIRGKEQRLSQIKPKICKLKEAAKPLLEILGLKSVDASAFEMYNKISYLPMELKLAYVNAGVYKELFGEESLTICCDGEVQEAVRQKEAISHKNDVEEDSEEEVEEEQKEEDQTGFEEEVNGNKKHRKRKSRHTKDRTAVLDKMQKKKDNLLSVHPISISIVLPCQNSLKIRLSFVFLTELKCVGLKSRVEGTLENGQLFDNDHLLDEIFEGDNALHCPNPVGNALLKMLDMNKLCGLAFSKTIDKEHAGETSKKTESMQQFELFENVMTRIKERVLARHVLSERINELELSKTIRCLPAELQQHLPTRTVSRLTSFKPISAEDFVIFNDFSQWQKSMVDDLWTADQLEKGFQFLGFVERSKFSMNVLVHIPANYPQNSSIVVLVIKSQEHSKILEYIKVVWQLETFLNTQTQQLIEHDYNKNELFALQMSLLCPKLDRTIEATAKKLDSKEFVGDSR
uniref:THO complex subunit 5 n=1 Tax=Ditylenchus dipsaci TaxID=166011 RepID=A0A915CWN2_9BILA